jgi:predicted kinase
MAAEIIMVVGCTGAGKTTYARRLSDDIGGLRFSIDEWMMPLFGPDIPQPIEFAWMMERVDRCEAMIWTMARQSVARGVPVVLDLGFTKHEHRRKFRDLAAEAGLSAAVHFIDVSRETRWHQVEQRNTDQGDTFAMHVDRSMFDFMESMWEPPTRAEWELNDGRRIAPKNQIG